jgi:hypothetical protein
MASATAITWSNLPTCCSLKWVLNLSVLVQPYNAYNPPSSSRQSLTPLRGAELEGHDTLVFRELGKENSMLGQIFTRSQNKIQDPAKLYKLVDLIDK